MEGQLRELIDLLNKASPICYELKIENSDNPDYYHFDTVWGYY